MNNNTSYIGKVVEVKMDRPFGSKHPKHGWTYETNYGFIPGVIASDGEELDAYVLGVNEPIDTFKGKVIAVIHRTNDDDDKLVVVPEDMELSDEEIKKQTHYQEQWFESIILRGGNSKFLEKMEELKQLNLPEDKFAVFGSGPMAIRGIREADDIDIIVLSELFEGLVEKYGEEKIKMGLYNQRSIQLGDIEVWEGWAPGEWNIEKLIKEADVFYGARFVKLEEVLKWKKLMGRDKDLKDIMMLRGVLITN